MKSKDAVKLAYIEFQKDFDDGEETNQWLTNVIKGLKQAEKDLEMLEVIKQELSDMLLTMINYIEDDYLGEVEIRPNLIKIKEWLKNEI